MMYCFVAFLADETQSFSLFLKWKITLGSLLVGTSMVAGSCSKPVEETTCYMPLPKDTIEEVTCYVSIPDTNVNQTMK